MLPLLDLASEPSIHPAHNPSLAPRGLFGSKGLSGLLFIMCFREISVGDLRSVSKPKGFAATEARLRTGLQGSYRICCLGRSCVSSMCFREIWIRESRSPLPRPYTFYQPLGSQALEVLFIGARVRGPRDGGCAASSTWPFDRTLSKTRSDILSPVGRPGTHPVQRSPSPLQDVKAFPGVHPENFNISCGAVLLWPGCLFRALLSLSWHHLLYY